ncbi:MAG: EI24 domain-containing protein [Alphaproteobacteria bacterium]
MLSALLRALADLSAPAVRRLAALGLALALASFLLVWTAIAILLARTAPFEWGPLNWLVDGLGGLAVLVVSWLIFPAVVTIVMGFFLDRIAAAVETLHYPGSGPARRSSMAETVATTVRLMATALLLNLLALPVYILAPGVNFFVFLGINGYLFGREYFEVVALRRLDPPAVRAARRRVAGRVFAAGIVIAGLFAIPLVNLVAAVIATAFMVHLLARMRAADPRLTVS